MRSIINTIQLNDNKVLAQLRVSKKISSSMVKLLILANTKRGVA